MTIEVVSFSPVDHLDLCVEAEKAAYLDAHRPRPAEEEVEKKLITRIKTELADNYWGFTALEENRPVGVIFVDELNSGNNAYAYIDNLYVRPNHRKKGIGKKLVLHAMDFLRSRGVQSLELTVTTANDAAVRLYRSLGFATTRLRMERGVEEPI